MSDLHPTDRLSVPPVPGSGGPVPDYAGSAQPAIPRRPWAISEILSWTVIILLVSLISVVATLEQVRPKIRSPEPDVSQIITSRMAVGIKAASDLTKGSAGAAKPLLLQLDRAAHTPVEKFRIALVRGELEDKAAALDQIDALADKAPPGNAGDDMRHDAAAIHQLYDTGQLPDDQMQRLLSRHGWFAKLAFATSQPPADPQRVHLMNSALFAMIAIEVAVFALMAVAGAGLIVLIIGILLLARGRVKTAFDRTRLLPPDRRSYVQAFALYLVGMATLGLFLRNVLHMPNEWAEAISLPAAFAIGFFWPRVKGQSWSQWRYTLGLHTGRGIFREMAGGLLGYIMGLPIMALGVILTLILAKLSGITATHPITQELTGPPGWIAVLFILASVWAPITEELMFRGALFSHLRERFPWWISAPVAALVFAMMHPQGWIAIPVLAAIAIVLAGIREWRGSIIGSMTAHAFHNTVTLICVLMLLG